MIIYELCAGVWLGEHEAEVSAACMQRMHLGQQTKTNVLEKKNSFFVRDEIEHSAGQDRGYTRRWTRGGGAVGRIPLTQGYTIFELP